MKLIIFTFLLVLNFINYSQILKNHYDLALDDVDYFFNTLKSVHPDLLRNTTTEKYLNSQKEIYSSLLKLREANKIDIYNIYELLQRAIVIFNDAHTSVFDPPIELIKTFSPKFQYPPFKFDYSNGDFYFNNSVPKYSEYNNAKIVKINGLSPKLFLEPIFERISAEKEEYKYFLFTNYQQLYFWTVQFITDTLNIDLELNNKKITMFLNAITFEDYNKNFPIQKLHKSNKFLVLSNNIGYYQFNSFDESSNNYSNIDSVFNLLSINHINNLVIDLRFNGGGSTNCGEYLFNYLLDSKYKWFSKTRTKYSMELISKYKSFNDSCLIGLLSNSEIMNYKIPTKGNNKFLGKLYLLVNQFTFSTAADFVAVVKDFGFGEIIGYETGGLRNSFGDKLDFKTPNYGIKFSVSFKEFFSPRPNINDNISGTIPDVVLNEETLMPYSSEVDPELSFVLDYIEKK